MELGDKFQYKVHLFVCTKCHISSEAESESESAIAVENIPLEFRKKLKLLCEEKFPKTDVRINISGCLSLCESGINAVIYPQNIWLTRMKLGDEEKVVDIIQQLIK